MRNALGILCLLLPLAGPVSAEPRHLLVDSGEWQLFRDDAYEIDWRDGRSIVIANACVAETVQVTTTVQLVGLQPSAVQADTALNGQLILRVGDTRWNYGQTSNQLFVSIMDKDHVVRALYNGPWITGLMGPWGTAGNPFGRAAAIWGEDIAFKDRQDNLLTEVRAGGLNTIYPQLLACAGL